MKGKEKVRFLFVIVLFLIFASFLTIPLLKIRYSIQGIEENELSIIRLSLTHAVEKEKNGSLVFTAASVYAEDGEWASDKRLPCPT